MLASPLAKPFPQFTPYFIATGSKYDIIPSELHKTQFKNWVKLKSVSAYGQKDTLNCKGYFNAAIRLGDKTVNSEI